MENNAKPPTAYWNLNPQFSYRIRHRMSELYMCERRIRDKSKPQNSQIHTRTFLYPRIIWCM